MQGQVIWAGESSLAQVALKRPVSGVFPVVTRQLVWPGELPATAFPTAVVGFLTCEHNKGKTFISYCVQSYGYKQEMK